MDMNNDNHTSNDPGNDHDDERHVERGRGERGRGGPRGGRGRSHGGHGRGQGPMGPPMDRFGGFGMGGPQFGPLRPSRARKGDVKAAILSLLAEEPSNGYQLIKTIRHATDGAWRPSPGSIYPTLQQLQDDGLIEPIGEGGRTQFALTDAGRAHITEHADELEAAWEGATGKSDEDAALAESIAKLMGAVHQLRFAADEKQAAQVAEILDDSRRSIYRILAD